MEEEISSLVHPPSSLSESVRPSVLLSVSQAMGGTGFLVGFRGVTRIFFYVCSGSFRRRFLKESDFDLDGFELF